MPPRIIPILDRLRQDIAAGLSRQTIEEACRQANHHLAQTRPRPGHHHLPLPAPGPPRQHRLPARRPLRRLGLHRQRLLPGPQAAPPGRLPLAPGDGPPRRSDPPPPAARDGSGIGSGSSTAPASRCPTSPSCDATSASPAARRKGCGFPVAKWLALFDLATGMLLRSATAPLRTHEMSQAGRRSPTDLEPGDVVLGDRGFCSYAHLALLLATSAARGVPRPSEADRRLHAGPARRPGGRAPIPGRRACRARGGWSPNP